MNHKLTIHIEMNHKLTIHKLTNKLTIHEFQVNRLTVVAVQEKEYQLLCITKTADATGRVEAAAVKEALDNWGSLRTPSSLLPLTSLLPTPE